MKKQLSPDELKRCELDILKDVAHFWDEHNIRNSLTFGTLYVLSGIVVLFPGRMISILLFRGMNATILQKTTPISGAEGLLCVQWEQIAYDRIM